MPTHFSGTLHHHHKFIASLHHHYYHYQRNHNLLLFPSTTTTIPHFYCYPPPHHHHNHHISIVSLHHHDHHHISIVTLHHHQDHISTSPSTTIILPPHFYCCPPTSSTYTLSTLHRPHIDPTSTFRFNTLQLIRFGWEFWVTAIKNVPFHYDLTSYHLIVTLSLLVSTFECCYCMSFSVETFTFRDSCVMISTFPLIEGNPAMFSYKHFHLTFHPCQKFPW